VDSTPKSVGLSVIVPVYDEAAGLDGTLGGLLPKLPADAEVVLVDDGSTDGSGGLCDAWAARDPRVRAVHHARNAGYGEALKTGAALARASRLVFFDADGQHDPDAIARLVARHDRGDVRVVVGRRTNAARAVPWRAPAKWVLSRVAEVLTRERIPDLNCGLRLVEADVLRRFLPLLPSGFSLSTTLTVSCLKLGIPMDWVDVAVRPRAGTSTVRPLRDGYQTVLLVVRLVALFAPLTFFLPIAGGALFASLFYGIVVALVRGQGFPTAAVFGGLSGLLVFLLGIVCDQISALRLEMLNLRSGGVQRREGP
jgi:glycosyltransferase involved in cell wall biosynthesis